MDSRSRPICKPLSLSSLKLTLLRKTNSVAGLSRLQNGQEIAISTRPGAGVFCDRYDVREFPNCDLGIGRISQRSPSLKSEPGSHFDRRTFCDESGCSQED